MIRTVEKVEKSFQFPTDKFLFQTVLLLLLCLWGLFDLLSVF